MFAFHEHCHSLSSLFYTLYTTLWLCNVPTAVPCLTHELRICRYLTNVTHIYFDEIFGYELVACGTLVASMFRVQRELTYVSRNGYLANNQGRLKRLQRRKIYCQRWVCESGAACLELVRSDGPTDAFCRSYKYPTHEVLFPNAPEYTRILERGHVIRAEKKTRKQEILAATRIKLSRFLASTISFLSQHTNRFNLKKTFS